MCHASTLRSSIYWALLGSNGIAAVSDDLLPVEVLWWDNEILAAYGVY